MVINFGEAQVFKRHMAQARDCFIRREAAAANLFHQFKER